LRQGRIGGRGIGSECACCGKHADERRGEG